MQLNELNIYDHDSWEFIDENTGDSTTRYEVDTLRDLLYYETDTPDATVAVESCDFDGWIIGLTVKKWGE